MNLMRKGVLAAASATAALGLTLGATTPAAAATEAADAVHRGSVTCFNYSWGDGTVTWTVYYHNTCSSTYQFWVKTGATSAFETCITVGGDGQGSKVFYNKPLNFSSKAGKC